MHHASETYLQGFWAGVFIVGTIVTVLAAAYGYGEWLLERRELHRWSLQRRRYRTLRGWSVPASRKEVPRS